MKDLFEKQGWHALFLVLGLWGMNYAAGFDGILAGEYLGLTTQQWLWIALGVPIVQQVWVALVWRAELHNQFLSKRFGAERGFRLFGAVFIPLLAARPLAAFGLGIANQNTFELADGWRWGISILFLFPFLYLMYSIQKYFTIKRALGADHFFEEFRNLPLVKKGIFKYTNNGMYTFGFFILWIPGFLFASKAALLAAAFTHAYIWVHYFVTEKPDMKRIYG